MRPRTAVLALAAVGPVSAGLLAGCGGGHSKASTAAGGGGALYAAKWELQYHFDASGRRLASISRTSRELRLQVVDQTCHPGDPRYAASRRFAGASVQEGHAAVVVTVHMRPEPAVTGCAPAGVGFPITVKLAQPLGARALVDGGTPPVGGGPRIAVIRVPASSRSLERAAEARYGQPDVPQIP